MWGLRCRSGWKASRPRRCIVQPRTACASSERDVHASNRPLQQPLGAFQVPIRFLPDQVRPLKSNDVVSGRIESRGIHDLYTFDGHQGDVVRVSGAGCDISSLVLGFLLPNGSDTLAPSCRAGSDARLTQDGPYKLVVNAADGGRGEY